MANNSDLRRVVVPCRFSFAHVFTPKNQAKEGEPEKLKYSVSALIDPKDKDTMAKIKKAIEAAAKEGEVKKFKGKKFKCDSSNPKYPLKRGDDKFDEDPETYEAYEGMAYISCNGDNRPGIKDRRGNEIIDQDEFYSGCYGYVSITFYPYNADGVIGVAAGLNNVMKTKDGVRFAGGRSADEDFGHLYNDEVEDDDESNEYDW